MHIFAENRITINKAVFMEGMLRISRDSYQKITKLAVPVLLIAWLVMLVFTFVTQASIFQFLILLLMGLVLGLWLCVWMPRSNARRAWKVYEAKYGSTMERVAYFYEDHLLIQGEGVEKTVEYTDIHEIQRSKHLMILIGQDRVGVMLSLEGFVEGSADKAEALIKSAREQAEEQSEEETEEEEA